MIFNFSRKKQKRFMRRWSRELIGMTIDLESDVEVNGEAILDFVSDQLNMGSDLVEVADFLSRQVEPAGVQSTAVIVKDGNWLVVLSQDPHYELEF